MRRKYLSYKVGALLRWLILQTAYWFDLPNVPNLEEERQLANEFLDDARKICRELDGSNMMHFFDALEELKQEITDEHNNEKTGKNYQKVINIINKITEKMVINLEEDAKSFFWLGNELSKSNLLLNSKKDKISVEETQIYIPDNIHNYEDLYNLSAQYQEALKIRDRKRCSKLYRQIWDTVEKYYDEYRKRERKKSPKVFISHSHSDRDTASQLEIVLSDHGAQPYLDEQQIEPGDPLPDRLTDGIKQCDVFLLIWSYKASQSEWVDKEWNMAYEQRKKIIPYVIDRTPLPPVLENLVWVASEDRKHTNAKLLAAVFGRSFSPPPNKLFPGKWIAKIDAFGLGQSTAELELRANGQIIGFVKMNQGGPFGTILQDEGIGDLLNMNIPIQGTWTYEEGTQILTIEVIARGFGQQHHDVVKIKTTGHENSIQGEDLAGRTYTLHRKSTL
jgi:hypothetical protein